MVRKMQRKASGSLLTSASVQLVPLGNASTHPPTLFAIFVQILLLFFRDVEDAIPYNTSVVRSFTHKSLFFNSNYFTIFI